MADARRHGAQGPHVTCVRLTRRAHIVARRQRTWEDHDVPMFLGQLHNYWPPRPYSHIILSTLQAGMDRQLLTMGVAEFYGSVGLACPTSLGKPRPHASIIRYLEQQPKSSTSHNRQRTWEDPMPQRSTRFMIAHGAHAWAISETSPRTVQDDRRRAGPSLRHALNPRITISLSCVTLSRTGHRHLLAIDTRAIVSNNFTRHAQDLGRSDAST